MATQAAPQLLSAALGAVGLGGKGGAAPGGGGAAGGAPPTSLAGAEEFLKAQGPGLMSAAMGALKQHGQGGAGAGGAPAGGGGGGFAAQAEGFARQAAPGLLAQLGLSGDAAKPAAGDTAKPAAGASDAK